MKSYFITLFLLSLGHSLSAQTFFGPTIGYDFATLKTQRIFMEGEIIDGYWKDRLLIERAEKDNGSGFRTRVIGFQVKKILSEQWALGVRINYSRKRYFELVNNFWPSLYYPEYRILYQQFGLSVLFSRKIKEKVSVGIGPNISYFTKFSSPNSLFDPYILNKRAYGLNLQLGYYLGPVYLAVDYTRSLKVVDSSGYMKGASSLAISGTYFFELRKRK